MEIEEEGEERSRSLIYCMTVYKADSNTYKQDWLVLDKNNNGDHRTKYFYKEDELSKLNPRDDGFRCAVLGEEIYFVCCEEINVDGPAADSDTEPYHPSKEVKIYHTGKREWRDGEPMLIPRHEPTVAVLHGKIYVFGAVTIKSAGGECCFLHEGEPWAEFYDPSSNKWYPVLNIPPQCRTVGEFDGCAVISQTQILLWTKDAQVMCLFDAHEETWDVLECNEFALNTAHGNFNPKVVTRDNVLYWFYGDSLFAYDLAKNQSSSSSSHGGPIFTFDIWDGPNFLSDSYLFIDRMKDEVCLIWNDREAGSVSYTNFKLFEQQVDNGKRESRKGVKWCARYHSLELEKNKQQYYLFDPLHLNPYYSISRCLPAVKASSSSSKDVDNKEAGQGSYGPLHRRHFVLHNMYETMVKQIAACCAERDMREKGLRRKVLRSVKNQEQDGEYDMSMEEFLHKHGLQELSDIFKAKNMSLIGLKRMEERLLTSLKLPRNLRIKLAMALGWARAFSELYEARHRYNTCPCHARADSFDDNVSEPDLTI